MQTRRPRSKKQRIQNKWIKRMLTGMGFVAQSDKRQPKEYPVADFYEPVTFTWSAHDAHIRELAREYLNSVAE